MNFKWLIVFVAVIRMNNGLETTYCDANLPNRCEKGCFLHVIDCNDKKNLPAFALSLEHLVVAYEIIHIL